MGEVEFESRSLGEISVPNIKFYECENCGDKLLSLKESEKATEYIANKEKELIDMLPISEFKSLNEAAKILGITKQAFSKHSKIKRGIIYSAKIGNRKYYHRKSVELFKKNGNGKFLLTKHRIQRTHFEKKLFVGESQPQWLLDFITSILHQIDLEK